MSWHGNANNEDLFDSAVLYENTALQSFYGSGDFANNVFEAEVTSDAAAQNYYNTFKLEMTRFGNAVMLQMVRFQGEIPNGCA